MGRRGRGSRRRGGRGRDLVLVLVVPVVLLVLVVLRLAPGRDRPGWQDWLVAVLATGIVLVAVLWLVVRRRQRTIRTLGSGHELVVGCMVPELGHDLRWALTVDAGSVQLWQLARSPEVVRSWTGRPVTVVPTSVDLVTRQLPGLVIGDGASAVEVVVTAPSQLRWADSAERDEIGARIAEVTLGPSVAGS